MSVTSSPHHVLGIDLHVEQSGSGEPMVLVHGSWGSGDRWALVVDALAQAFRVVVYDRRGHGSSGSGPGGPATRLEQEDELAGLIEQLGRGPVHLVGNSFGGSMALSLAGRRPDLVRAVSAHEPPLLAFGGDDPTVATAARDVADVVSMIETGDRVGAAREFVERIALGPGGWELLPAEVQDQMIRHADTFAGEVRDDAWARADLASIECPVLLTCGNLSPAFFAPVMAGVAEAIPHASVFTIEGSGHVPHMTHAADYVGVLTRAARAGGATTLGDTRWRVPATRPIAGTPGSPGAQGLR